ncbi:MAG TPA: hypothetical protein VEV83_15465 [Parafilimonas sp.]|nr:hypothetical protein [Parafilimonas sp.]
MSFTESVTLTANTSSFTSAMQAAETAIKAAAAAAASSASSFTSQASSMSNAAASVQRSITVYNSYGQAVKAAGSSGTALTGSLSQLSSSASSSQGAIRGMEAAVANSATTTNNANSAVKFYGTSLTTSGQASAAAGTKFNAMGQAISTNVDAAQKTSTSFGALNNVMGQTSQTTEQTATSTQKMGVNFSNAVGFMGAAIGSGVQLFETFESLERAQVGVDRAQNQLTTSQIKVTSLQNQLNKLTAEGKTGTAEYSLVQEKLAAAHEKAETAADRLQLKQNDLNVTYADFAKNIIPEVISVGATMTGALGNMGVSTAGLKEKFSALIPALTGGATGMRGFGAALASIALNPFTIALTALAAALIAYKTNFLGFRDVTNEAGVAVGNLNPVLKLGADALLAFGQTFGIAGGDIDKTSQAMHKDVDDIGKSWNLFLVILQRGVDAVGEILSNFFAPLTGALSQLAAALDPAAAAIEGFFSTISSSLDPAAAAIESALTAIDTAISNFFQQTLSAAGEIESWLDTNIVQPIIKGIQAIPAKLTTSAIDLVAVVWNALKAAGKAITDAAQWVDQMILTPIANAINTVVSIASRINKIDIVAIVWETLKSIGKPISDALAWLATNIFNPIVAAINTGLQTIGGGLGKIDLVNVIWQIIKANSKPITDAGAWINKNLIDPIVKSLEGAEKAFQGGIKGLQEWGAANDLSKQKVDSHSGSVVKQSASLNEAGGKFLFVADTVSTANGLLGENGDITNKSAQATDQLSAAQAKEANQITANLNAIKSLSDNYRVAIETSAGFSDSLTKEDLEANRTLAVYNAMGAELTKLKDANKNAGIEVDALTKLMQESAFVQELQTKGVLEQQKALLSTEQETAVMQGKLQELNSELSRGEAQWVSYQNGIAKANLEFAQNEQKIAASQGELESLNEHLRDGSASFQAYRQGIVEADIEYDKFITSSIQAGAKQLELNDRLTLAARAFGGLPGFIEPTIQNLEAFVKAGMSLTGTLKDNGEAMKQFEEIATKSWNDMTAAGQDFFKKLIDSARKGGTDMVKGFDDAMQDLPPAVWENLTAADEQALKAGALFAAAGQNAAELFSVKLQSGINQGMDFNTAVGYAKQAAIDMVQQFVDQNPAMAAEGQKFIEALTNATGTGINQVLQQFSSMPGPIGQMAQQMLQAYQSQGMNPMVAGSQTAATQSKAALTDIPTAAQTFGQIATLFQQQVEQTLPRMATNAANGVRTAINVIPGAVNAAFSRAAGDAGGYLATIMRNSQTAFAAVGNAANAVVGPINAAFSRAASVATSAFNTIRSQATSAFNAVGQAGQQAGSRVSSGMQAIQQSAQRATQQVQQLKSMIDSLRDKRVTITVYVGLTGPGVGYLQHGGILYAQHGAVIDSTTKPPFITDRQMKRGNAVIGEFGKPELVLPLSKHPGDVADKEISVKSQYAKGFGGGGGGRPSTMGGGKQEVSVKGKISNDVPINVYLDSRKIMSTVQRQLLEFSDAAI